MKVKSALIKGSATILAAIFLAANVANSATMEPVRGVVKSVQEAVLSVDLYARVVESPVKAGESFKKDDVLLKFDCKVQQAEARAAKAAFSALKMVHKNNVELKKYGAIGEFDVSVSKSEMQQAMAHAEAVTARTRDCEIRAPFDGRVAELAINVFEIPRASQPLLKIVSSGEFEIRLIVPSSWLAWLRTGSEFEFNVDETGAKYQASVSQIGAEVDAVSRTVPIVARFTTLPTPVLSGMSGTGHFIDSHE